MASAVDLSYAASSDGVTEFSHPGPDPPLYIDRLSIGGMTHRKVRVLEQGGFSVVMPSMIR